MLSLNAFSFFPSPLFQAHYFGYLLLGSAPWSLFASYTLQLVRLLGVPFLGGLQAYMQEACWALEVGDSAVPSFLGLGGLG